MPILQASSGILKQEHRVKNQSENNSFRFLHAPLSRQPRRSPRFQISFRKPAARFNQLDDIYPLFAEHDWKANACDYPGPERIHLVRSRELERTSTVWVGEKGGNGDVGRVAWL
jgi:hypothetical protein